MDATQIAQTNTPVELSSAKLTELLDAKKTARGNFANAQTDADADAAEMELFKISKQIEIERANLRKLDMDAKIAEQRNARAAIADNFETAILAHAANPTPENLDALNTARETIKNELLAKFAASTPAKKTTDGNATTTDGQPRGATSAKILELYLAKTGAGMSESDARIELEKVDGYARGTVWHAINNYKKSLVTV